MLIRNFLFHRVSDEVDNEWPPMKPELFKKTIVFLKKKYRIVNLEDFLEDNSIVKNAKKPLATILFDDGYKDNIQFAAPILQENDCPASFYVVTDCITRNYPTWTFLLDYILQSTRKTVLYFELDIVPEEYKVVKLSDKATMSRVKPWMKTLSNDDRIKVLDAALSQCTDITIPMDKMMNWNDVRELSNNGFVIGSHSHTHPILSSIKNENEILRELQTSYETLQHEMGKPPLTISYPNGGYDFRVIKLSQEIGYKFGLAVETRFFKPAVDNRMAIPRVELYQESWLKSRFRMTKFYQASKQLFH